MTKGAMTTISSAHLLKSVFDLEEKVTKGPVGFTPARFALD
ncbi:hypothetical protein [Veronia pacifica]|nr:hypothetical protein [Veronia pacifica]